MSYQNWRRRATRWVPSPLRVRVTTARLARSRRRNSSRSVEEVFSEVYASRQWGEGEAYDSGSGSRGTPATSYAAYVRDLISRTGARRAVDIGCGDFRVARLFVDDLEAYEGLDVVKDLVAQNQARFGRRGVNFPQLDAANDDLPDADLCLIRQVLQHLSNGQISEILRRCRRYQLVVVTEHLPDPGHAGAPNQDKPHGPDTRLDAGSWVDIGLPPFGCAPISEVLRLPVSRPLYHLGETIRTQLWRPEPIAPC